MGERIEHGWVSLGNGAEVHLDHGVPTDVCMMHAAAAPSPAALAGKIADLTGLRVSVGEWRAGETAAERLAAVRVSREHLNEVLRRLALASARCSWIIIRRQWMTRILTGTWRIAVDSATP